MSTYYGFKDQQEENKAMRKLIDSVTLLSRQLPTIKPTEPNVGDTYRDPLTLNVKCFDGKGWNVIFSDEEAMKGTISVEDEIKQALSEHMVQKSDKEIMSLKKLFESMRLPDWSVNPAHNNDGNFSISQDEREVLDSTYEKDEKEESQEAAYERAMKVI